MLKPFQSDLHPLAHECTRSILLLKINSHRGPAKWLQVRTCRCEVPINCFRKRKKVTPFQPLSERFKSKSISSSDRIKCGTMEFGNDGIGNNMGTMESGTHFVCWWQLGHSMDILLLHMLTAFVEMYILQKVFDLLWLCDVHKIDVVLALHVGFHLIPLEYSSAMRTCNCSTTTLFLEG